MERIDFKKDFKYLYKAPSSGFAFVEVPSISFLMADGAGDPNNSPHFHASIETLYGLAYTIKFSLKKSGRGPEYSIPPLEGLWWCEGIDGFETENRQAWRWTLMIAQPAHIDGAMVDLAAKQLEAKGKELTSKVRLERMEEGLCVHGLHIGPYSDEAPRIAAMHAFINERGYRPRGRHHEIYLSDPRRTAPEKLKTILRQPVSKMA